MKDKIGNYLNAISRLFTYSSNKRQSIKNNVLNIDDEIGGIVQEIIKEVYADTNIDILHEVSNTELITFETELNKCLFNFSNNNVVELVDLEDEIDLLKSYKSIDPNYFNERNIKISCYDKLISSMKYPVNKRSIISHAIIPDYLHLVKNGDDIINNHYFATSRTKSHIYIYHLNHPSKKMNEVNISTVLVFPKNAYTSVYSNPTRAFLSILDDFGFDIIIENVTRRFFKSVLIPSKNAQGKLIHLTKKFEKGKKWSIHHNISASKVGALISFAYGINYSQYEEEL